MIQWLRIPLPIQRTQVLSLGWEDRLEKAMASHSSILSWRIPWTEESGEVYTYIFYVHIAYSVYMCSEKNLAGKY